MQDQHLTEGKRSIELAAGNREDVVELSFASETPVTLEGFEEILSCRAEDVDLTRLRASAPLLLNHDTNQQIGVIESATVSNGKARAVVRFSKSAKAQEILADVKSGIRRLVSVGYRRTKELANEVRDGVQKIRFAWQPYELSVVAIPADFSIGIGRDDHSAKLTRTMTVNESQTERNIAEIKAIATALEGKATGDVQALAARHIATGASIEAFRKEALAMLPSAPVTQPAPLFDQRDLKGYNLGKAILEFAERGRLSGLEAELSDDIGQRTNRRPSSFFVPTGALSLDKRGAVAGTATLGGYLVETSVSSDWIDVLRARSVFGRMGVSTMSGLYGNVAFPRLNGSSAVQWLSETSTCTLSALNWQQVLLSPKAACAGVEYSKMLLTQSNVHDIVVTDLTNSIAAAIDAGIAHGAGTNEFTGLQIATGVNSVTIAANGGVPSWDNVLDLEEAVETANGTVGSSGYVTNPKVRSYLKKTPMAASGDIAQPVWSVQRSTDGFETLNAYKAAVTSAIASNLTRGTSTTLCSAIFYSSDWSQAVLGLWNALDLQVDPITQAANRITRVWAHQFCDFQLKKPACFARTLELLAN